MFCMAADRALCLFIKVGWLFMLVAVLPCISEEFGWRDWWKRTIMYQIYPRSFMDSDGDGVGDLRGISLRVDHFNNIGVGTIWLGPIYKSPMKDFGYDVSDYEAVDPLFGTMDDFDNLIRDVHERDLKMIIDFIPNHSSDQHQWFLNSKKSKTNPYADYYVWQDPKPGCTDVPEQCVPNNWVSLFGGSMWEWVPDRQQFYLHQFLIEQPDLNLRNHHVREELRNVLRFWFRKGVDGFRIDADKHFFESEDLEDEPLNPYYRKPVEGERVQYSNFIHTKTIDLPEIEDLFKEWRGVFEEFSTCPNYRLMIIEDYDTHKRLGKYYGTLEQPEVDFPFNFVLTKLRSTNRSGYTISELISSWMDDLPSGKWPNWVMGNHDNPRVSSRVGRKYVRAMNTLLLLLPGTPTTYYGEEIGMENVWVPFSQTVDRYAKDNPDHWEFYDRDPERSPMQWSREVRAGFSNTSGNSWLPINTNYLYGINVEDQTSKGHPWSVMSHYKKLATLRKEEPAFQTHHLQQAVVNERIFSFLRLSDDPNRHSFLVIINIGNSSSTDDYVSAIVDKTQFADSRLLDGYYLKLSSRPRLEHLTLNNVTVDAGEVLVVGFMPLTGF